MPSLFDPLGQYQPGSSLFGSGLGGFGGQLGAWGYGAPPQSGGPGINGVTPMLDQPPLGGPELAPGQAEAPGFTGADPFSTGGFAPGFGSGPSDVAAGGQWGRSADDLRRMGVYGNSAFNTGLDRGLDTLGLGLLTAGLPLWGGAGVDAIQRKEGGMSWAQALLGAGAGAFLPGGDKATDKVWDYFGNKGESEEPAGVPGIGDVISFGGEGEGDPAWMAGLPEGNLPGGGNVANPWDHTGHWAPIRGADQLNFYGSSMSMDPTAGDVLFMTGLTDFYGPRR